MDEPPLQPGAGVHPAVRIGSKLVGGFREVVAPEGENVDSAYRAQLLGLLTVALALDYADRASIGALGPDIKDAFDVGNTGFGLVASAFGVVGAVATIPAGVLTDRAPRTTTLGASMLLWTLAMGATGAAATFTMLLAARVFLGAVTATARPMIASITGDVFDRGLRARALGLIDSRTAASWSPRTATSPSSSSCRRSSSTTSRSACRPRSSPRPP